MIQTLKRFSLVDPSNVKDERISKNAQLNILGGYGDGYLWCTCYWAIHSESGWCASNNHHMCEIYASDKYPQTEEWFGSFSHCDCV